MNAIGAVSAISGTAGISTASSVSAITPVGGSGAVDGTTAAQSTGNSFLGSLTDAFGQLNSQLTGTDAAISSFASGGSADLHTVMLQMQEASVSLKAATQVRDKLLEAYQEIMRTQI
jgi:flagellar hook-basal body complex protein FliE